MQFEWDAAKDERNRAERGIPFRHAVELFRSPVLTWRDLRLDYGEARWCGLGRIGDRVYALAWTVRGIDVIRIISVRKANARETQRYWRETGAEGTEAARDPDDI